MARFKEQFKWRNFGFHCEYADVGLFYRTQYSGSRLLYLFYRAFMFAYQLGWFLAYYIYQGINNPAALRSSYWYLTLWGFAINFVYFTLNFILAFIGYVRRGDLILDNSKGIHMLRGTVWLLHSIGQAGAIIITIVFWISLAPNAPSGSLDDAFNINQHAINSVVYLIEIFIVAFPMRLLHFVYPMIFGVIYVVATLIYHFAGITSKVYRILDWQNNLGIAVAYSVGCIGGCAVVHFFMFLLHILRSWINGKCCNGNSSRRRNSPNAARFAYSNSGYVLTDHEKKLPAERYFY